MVSVMGEQTIGSRWAWPEEEAPRDVAAVLAYLDRQEAAVRPEQRLSVLRQDLRPVFGRLKELTADEPVNRVWPHMARILPYCFGGGDGDSEATFSASDLRERLTDWLDQYPQRAMSRLRARVLDAVRARLLDIEMSPQGACWTAAAIGYRRDDVVAALWAVEKRNNGDEAEVALAALAALGLQGRARQRLLQRIHERVALGLLSKQFYSKTFSNSQRQQILRAIQDRASDGVFSLPLASALRRLAAPGSVGVIRQHWLDSKAWGEPLGRGYSALQLLADIADAAPGDANLQAEIWGIVTEQLASGGQEVAWILHMGGIGQKCNSDAVVPTLVDLFTGSWNTVDREDPDRTAHHRFLLSLRLAECLRPQHLDGWTQLNNIAALSTLRADVAQDTHSGTSLAQTIEMARKEAAWETLLLWGRASNRNVFSSAIAEESNPFVRARMLRQLSSFRLDPLPPFVEELIRGRYDQREGEPYGELLVRLAAIQVAGSAPSRGTFAALRRCGLTNDGEVPQATVDALVDVAEVLLHQGEMPALDALVDDMLAPEQRDHGRGDALANSAYTDLSASWEAHHGRAAIGAVSELAKRGWLRQHHLPQVVEGLLDEERDLFERGCLLDALENGTIAPLPGAMVPKKPLQGNHGILPPQIENRLHAWASGDDDLAERALLATARRGNHPGHMKFLEQRLSLQFIGGSYDLPPRMSLATSQGQDVAMAVGQLYQRAPARFLPAVRKLIHADNYAMVLHGCAALQNAHGKPGQPPMPAALQIALIERIRMGSPFGFSEVAPLSVAAALIPNVFAREAWSQSWEQWRPEVRAALADLLGTLKIEEAGATRATVQSLLALTGDGQYGVRRAAYRALARRVPDALGDLCLEWSFSRLVALRERAAEGWGWLENAKTMSTTDSAIWQALTGDREPAVRRALARASAERHERTWAEQALDRIERLLTAPEPDIRQAWRHGEALIRYGDDGARRTLADILNREHLAPNVRHWLIAIAKELGERWEKTTKSWPDPWLTWEGALEEVAGSVSIDEGAVIGEGQLTLWRDVPVRGKSAWGGTAPANTMLAARAGLADVIIAVDGRGSGRATVKHVSNARIAFVGSGPYPG
jgi:hypothetical protein